MLISKFDLYKSEWLELVFDDRNKAYGAYELRQHYSQTMLKAMAIAFLTIMATIAAVGMIIRPVVPKVTSHDHTTVVDLSNYVRPAVLQPPKPIVHIKPTAPRALTAPTNVKAYVPFVVTSKPVVTDPPKISTLTGPIGPVDVKTPGGSTTVDPGTPGGTPGGTGTETSDTPVGTVGLEALPEPYGGAAAWSKFLQKHLKYPDMAIDNHAQGKVWVSFIVEKDGHLSDITVDRGIGFGTEEEALRVLKLAPAWKPGIQNGHPVRVKYNLPINFLLGDDNN